MNLDDALAAISAALNARPEPGDRLRAIEVGPIPWEGPDAIHYAVVLDGYGVSEIVAELTVSSVQVDARVFGYSAEEQPERTREWQTLWMDDEWRAYCDGEGDDQ